MSERHEIKQQLILSIAALLTFVWPDHCLRPYGCRMELVRPWLRQNEILPSLAREGVG